MVLLQPRLRTLSIRITGLLTYNYLFVTSINLSNIDCSLLLWFYYSSILYLSRDLFTGSTTFIAGAPSLVRSLRYLISAAIEFIFFVLNMTTKARPTIATIMSIVFSNLISSPIYPGL